MIAMRVVGHEGKRFFRQRWWWTIVGRNGEVLCASEGYSSASKRDKTAKAVAAQLNVRYDV